MKKTYINPTCKTVEIDCQELTVTSPRLGEGPSDPNKENLSKHGDFYDDEDY